MIDSDNEEVLTLLREIRDLQRLHVENYKDALKNQVTAIETQQKSVRSSRIILLVVVVIVIVAIALTYRH